MLQAERKGRNMQAKGRERDIDRFTRPSKTSPDVLQEVKSEKSEVERKTRGREREDEKKTCLLKGALFPHSAHAHTPESHERSSIESSRKNDDEQHEN